MEKEIKEIKVSGLDFKHGLIVGDYSRIHKGTIKYRKLIMMCYDKDSVFKDNNVQFIVGLECR